MADATAGYPATLEIDSPDRELDRLTTLARVITVIPIAIVLGLVMGPSPQASSGAGSHPVCPEKRQRNRHHGSYAEHCLAS